MFCLVGVNLAFVAIRPPLVRAHCAAPDRFGFSCLFDRGLCDPEMAARGCATSDLCCCGNRTISYVGFGTTFITGENKSVACFIRVLSAIADGKAWLIHVTCFCRTGRIALGFAIANVYLGLHISGEAPKFFWCGLPHQY